MLNNPHIFENGFHSNLHSETKLIIIYSKAGDMLNACRIFNNKPKRSMLCWIALLPGYSQNVNSEGVLKV